MAGSTIPQVVQRHALWEVEKLRCRSIALSLTATFLSKLSKSVSLCRSNSVSSQCRSLRHGDRVDGSNALCFRVVRPSVCACVCASGRKHSPVGLSWTSAYFFSYFMCCLFWRIKTVHGQGCSPERELGGRLKQDLDKDLQLHRILILLY